MSDSELFSMCHQTDKMSISKLFLKNIRLQHFCLKMQAVEKWCVTKVAHCIYLFHLFFNQFVGSSAIGKNFVCCLSHFSLSIYLSCVIYKIRYERKRFEKNDF